MVYSIHASQEQTGNEFTKHKIFIQKHKECISSCSSEIDNGRHDKKELRTGKGEFPAKVPAFLRFNQISIKQYYCLKMPFLP